jgi:NTP pyrophosphatase (non-canonical NTP hydrolase)
MTLNDYQKEAQKTAIYPVLGHPIVYPALGLNGEAGEVAEKVKKLMRDFDGHMNDSWKLGILKELGDVLWYISETARQAGFTLQEVAEYNIKKLQEREKLGTLKGSGDDR